MRRTYLVLIGILSAAQVTHAQWTTSGSNIFNSNTGNVGIGITGPLALLHISGTVSADKVNGLALDNIGSSNGSGTALYMGYQNSGLGMYGARILQTGFPSNTRSADLSFQIHGGPADNFDSSWVTALFIQRITANVGIGTTSPDQTLSLQNPTTPAIDFYTGANNRAIISATNNLLTLNSLTSNPISFQINSSELMHINANGSVGIGTTSPGTYKLAINGNVHAQQVNIDMTGWSDYVFKRSYVLPSLESVKSYINKNHHLPEIPSEKEIINGGLDLGEMNKLLMKKVEELTLYLIEKDKQIADLKQSRNAEQAELSLLRAQMEQVNNRLDSLNKYLTNVRK